MAEQKPTTEPTATATDATSEPTTSTSESHRSRLTHGERWAIASSGLLGLVFVGGMIGSIVHNDNEARNHRRLDGELSVEVVDDGFKGVAEGTQYTGVGGEVYGTLHISDDCSLQGVRIHYGEKAGHVADVTDYTVTLLMNGVSSQENDHRNRNRSVLEGNIVEKHFTDLASFAQAAGAMTCSAMDENLQLQADAYTVRAR